MLLQTQEVSIIATDSWRLSRKRMSLFCCAIVYSMEEDVRQEETVKGRNVEDLQHWRSSPQPGVPWPPG